MFSCCGGASKRPPCTTAILLSSTACSSQPPHSAPPISSICSTPSLPFFAVHRTAFFSWAFAVRRGLACQINYLFCMSTFYAPPHQAPSCSCSPTVRRYADTSHSSPLDLNKPRRRQAKSSRSPTNQQRRPLMECPRPFHTVRHHLWPFRRQYRLRQTNHNR
ncbi:hypothetical protein DFJ73DRAFT_833478 [Zopfochytrium polystomum]|nr:hypothetical protein DFJ73DRAFT_833478 [Zopfochytrium polystomum]